MHFHFPFSTEEILWTLTFAAHLILLVVLIGRDRAKRFPLFTASIALIAFRLLATHMLFGRLPQMTLAAVFISTACLGALVSALVLVELARRAFGGIKRPLWVGSALVLMLLGAVVLAFWGEWPSWQTLTGQGTGGYGVLQLVQFIALKASLLVDVETVLVGLAIVLFGRRYSGGWRTHVQRIAIGLSTASLAQIGMEAAWQVIARNAKPKSMAEYQQVMGMRDHLFNANSVIYILVLVWWIAVLWPDEPKPAAPVAIEPVTTPEPDPSILPS